MAKKKPLVFETPSTAKLCVHCRGSDGKEKEIYETPEAACRRAAYIKEERGVTLKIYQCPKGNGWHLTKDATEYDSVYFSNGYGGRISWEYSTEECPASAEINVVSTGRKASYKKPIIKIESKAGRKITVTGKISEHIKEISIEKLFNISLNNTFSFYLAKDFLDDSYHQITIFEEKAVSKNIRSYTALVRKTDILEKKIKKGDLVSANMEAKSINGKTVWKCTF
ncbi:MAG: hypothetical protein LBC27_06450 [Spirochaetaceae bacterium]|nr:hypothetical protein [Spirochaetaceae bacterium]